MIRSLRLTVLIGVALACAAAEDLPLGTLVQSVDGAVVVGFDAPSTLLPDDMVAIYGPGSVTKHPLTGEVTIEQRKLVAKAQILEVSGTTLRGRVTWAGEGVVLEPGFDVVPMPGEASPDAPPVLSGAVEAVTVEAQSTVTLRVPVQDPEGGRLAVVWSTEGALGAQGRLWARTTVRPEVRWTAPAVAGTVTVRATVTDRRGQRLDVDLPVTVAEIGDGWRRRTLVGFADQGGREVPAWHNLNRGAIGAWWGVSSEETVHRIAAGWNEVNQLAVQDGVRLSGALAVVPRNAELFVLDGSQRSVMVLAHDGVLRRQIGAFQTPTDLVLDSTGAVYVADQRGGGVQVYEPEGNFRLRLGRPGEAEDSFTNLTRIAIGPADELYCLDAEAFRIQRFDRFHRRLGSWAIQGDRENPPVDLVVHARGLLVLLQDGTIQVFNPKGVANEALRPLFDEGWFDDLEAPVAIAVDGTGDILVSYPEEGLVARYQADGQFAGVRGGSLWAADRYAADGRGRVFGLDEDTGLISAFDAEGWMTARFGGTERYGGPFERPGAMTASADGKYLYVLDTRRITVMRFDLERTDERPFVFGQRGENPGQFEEPVALAVDGSGRCYVLDADLHRFAVFNPQGGFLFNVGRYERGRASDELNEPIHIAVTDDGSAAFVYDADRYEVMKFSLDQAGKRGEHVSNAGGRGRELGQFYGPVGMACDRTGLLYVLDSRRYDLQAIDFSGTNAVTVHAAALPDLGMRRPADLALAPDGLVWVAGEGRVLGLRWER
ncbi:MAG: hypothetical protein PF961_06735 [Planctomycetota bacterium]|jgi:DNA-binding beta-propeller fold protein YncE|nr:hypothetical protein [Planctomycetota bacterium]